MKQPIAFQPSLSPYYGNLQTGVSYAIQVKMPWYSTIGHGSYSVLSPNEISFSGYYSALGHSGKITIDLTVTGNNVGNITFNNHSYPCTFQVDGNDLIINLNEGNGPTSLKMEFWHSGMWIGGDGIQDDIWIGPA